MFTARRALRGGATSTIHRTVERASRARLCVSGWPVSRCRGLA